MTLENTDSTQKAAFDVEGKVGGETFDQKDSLNVLKTIQDDWSIVNPNNGH
jgi:hypothetical protein